MLYKGRKAGYALEEDLWRIPGDALIDISGGVGSEVVDEQESEAEDYKDFYYISADRCIDPYIGQVDSSWLISQAEYESKVNGLGEMTDILNESKYGYEWGWSWWQEHDSPEEIYMTIEAELLNWQR
ncbi:MAG: hypothetical protein K2L82_14015 [Lachnospiraceae bacterium]|nr:hypothetical protein [Lachnospiraceae bacterium]